MGSRKTRFFDSQLNRITIAIVVGILISVAVTAIMIAVGYSHAYANNSADADVRLLGVPLYHITRNGEQYTGQPVMQNMVFFGLVCSLLLSLIAELLWRGRQHDEQ